MKKILVCTGYFYPHIGGHERYVEELYSRLTPDEFQIHILTVRTGTEPAEEIYRNFQVHRVDGWNILGGTYPIPIPNRLFWRTLHDLGRKKFALINTHTRFFLMSVVGTLLAKIWGIHRLHTEHGTVHPQGGWFVRLGSWWYDHTFGWVIMRSASEVIAISESAALFSRHLGAQKIMVVPNGVDVDFFQPTSNQTNGKLRLLFIGRIIPAKGLTDLFAVLRLWSRKDWELSVVGSGSAEKQLKEKTADFPMIHWNGPLQTREILPLLQQCDIFINPSYAEGLPTSVLEAASCGCAIIATKVGGTSEIFSFENQQWLVEPGDIRGIGQRLERLAADPVLRESVGRKNREAVVEKYAWSKISIDYTKWLNNYFQREQIPC